MMVMELDNWEDDGGSVGTIKTVTVVTATGQQNHECEHPIPDRNGATMLVSHLLHSITALPPGETLEVTVTIVRPSILDRIDPKWTGHA